MEKNPSRTPATAGDDCPMCEPGTCPGGAHLNALREDNRARVTAPAPAVASVASVDADAIVGRWSGRSDGDYRREYWLNRMAVYAGRLAEDSFLEAPPVAGMKPSCAVCGARTDDRTDPLVHANQCPVGQILHALAKLRELEAQPSSSSPAASVSVGRDRSPAMESEICGLIFDARRLAGELLVLAPRSSECGCMLCGHTVAPADPRGHDGACMVGHVLERLERMGELAEISRGPAAQASAAGPASSPRLRGEDALYGPAAPAADREPCALPGCSEGGVR